MKKIGIIGGIGPESSIEYYRLIIKGFQEQLGTKEYPEIIINSINMTKMLGYVFENRLDELTDFLAHKITTLEKAGVDYCAMASNTPHIVFDALQSKVSLPLISIVEETCKYISGKNIKQVGLLGTKSTMSNGFYSAVANKYNSNVITPSSGNQDYIHAKYMSELIFNNILPETKQQLIKIVRELKENNSIEGLILGGTELPLILHQSDFNDIEIFDTTKIHVASIISKMIEE